MARHAGGSAGYEPVFVGLFIGDAESGARHRDHQPRPRRANLNRSPPIRLRRGQVRPGSSLRTLVGRLQKTEARQARANSATAAPAAVGQPLTETDQSPL